MVAPTPVDTRSLSRSSSLAARPPLDPSSLQAPDAFHPAMPVPLTPSRHHSGIFSMHASSPPFAPLTYPSPTARVKRLAFLSPQGEQQRTPYLWDLYETAPTAAHAFPHNNNGATMPPLHLDAHTIHDFHAAFPAQAGAKGMGMGMGMGVGPQQLELPPLERATTEQFQAVFSPAHHPHPRYPSQPHPLHEQHEVESLLGEPVGECDRCWMEAAQCPACRQAKQAQFLDGWPIDAHSNNADHAHWEHANNMHNQQLQLQHQQPGDDAIPMPPIQSEPSAPCFDEEKVAAALPLPPLVGAPAPGVGQGYEALARVQGKLARFLGPESEHLEGEADADSSLCPPLELPSPMLSSAHPPSGRSMRVRKIRSRSPSLDLSDSEESGRSTPVQHYHESDLDDSLSPPPPSAGAAAATTATPVRNALFEGASSDDSGQSSAEPPLPTSLLPVSASALLPSRPSTAAVPPAHIKDRLVKSAKKLLTAADGVDTAVQVQVIPIYFPSKGASGAHKIRLIRVFNTDTQQVSMYAHAADVGGVVERKSNISRLFGKFESPAEKLLMNVVGSHNHTVGQESNILTSRGVRKFLSTNKMKTEHAYRAWINSVLLPKLMADPLVIGEELIEIEASTDPNAPHTIKPVKMRRMEKKQAQKRKEAEAAAASASSSSSPFPHASDLGHVSKRQKTFHSPVMSAAASPLAPLTPKLKAASSSAHQSHAA